MIIVSCFLVYVILIGLIYYFRSYKKDLLIQIKKEDAPFFFLYALSLAISDYFLSKNPEQIKKKKAQLKELYVREDMDVCYAAFAAKRIALLLILVIGMNTLVLLVTITSTTIATIEENGEILRPTYGASSKMVDVRVAIEEDGIYIEEDLTLEIQAREYTQETFEEDYKKVQPYLDEVLLGNNVSKDQITTALNLVEWVPGTGIYVKWNLYDQQLIKADGSLQQDTVKEATQLLLQAQLKTEEGYEGEYEILLTVYPKEQTKEEQLRTTLNKELEESLQSNKQEESIMLPTIVGEAPLHIEEVTQNSLISILILGGIVAILLFLLSEEQVQKQSKEREEQVLLDYPELLNRFTLLLGAGMTIKNAWERIATDYVEKVDCGKKKRYVYEEMVVTWNEIKNGVNEVRAYENFGRRMRLVKYLKFSALLTQYATRGMNGLLASLEYEAVDAFENRKEVAKRYGEKASTKLLAPMMIMLLVVLVMIMVPVAISL